MKMIDTFFKKYAPILAFVMWVALILNHWSRDLNWEPLTIVLIPLIGLVWSSRDV